MPHTKSLPNLSVLIKKLAEMNLRDPSTTASSEAMHAALLFAHAGWNRAVGRAVDYKPILREFVASKPGLWPELVSSDPETLIDTVAKAKQRRWPKDTRVVIVCGIVRSGNIRVEWCWPEDYEATMRSYGLPPGFGGHVILHHNSPPRT